MKFDKEKQDYLLSATKHYFKEKEEECRYNKYWLCIYSILFGAGFVLWFLMFLNT